MIQGTIKFTLRIGRRQTLQVKTPLLPGLGSKVISGVVDGASRQVGAAIVAGAAAGATFAGGALYAAYAANKERVDGVLGNHKVAVEKAEPGSVILTCSVLADDYRAFVLDLEIMSREISSVLEIEVSLSVTSVLSGIKFLDEQSRLELAGSEQTSGSKERLRVVFGQEWLIEQNRLLLPKRVDRNEGFPEVDNECIFGGSWSKWEQFILQTPCYLHPHTVEGWRPRQDGNRRPGLQTEVPVGPNKPGVYEIRTCSFSFTISKTKSGNCITDGKETDHYVRYIGKAKDLRTNFYGYAGDPERSCRRKFNNQLAEKFRRTPATRDGDVYTSVLVEVRYLVTKMRFRGLVENFYLAAFNYPWNSDNNSDDDE